MTAATKLGARSWALFLEQGCFSMQRAAPPPCCCSSSRLQSTHSLLLSQTGTYAPGKSGMALPVRALAFVSNFPFGLSLLLIRQDFKKGQTVPARGLCVPCQGSRSYHLPITRMASVISVCTNETSVLSPLHQGPHGETVCLDLVFPLLPFCKV